MFGWCAFFFFLAIGYELLKYYRQLHLLRAQTRTVSVTEENGTTSSSTATQESQGDSHISAGDKYDGPLHRRSVTEKREIKMLSIVHVVQTALHVIQIFVSYVLMLAFMLFNVWICLAVVLGAGVGYFLVGSRKHTTYSALDEDHCHWWTVTASKYIYFYLIFTNVF